MSVVQFYDTTLRDGAQREGISFSVVDKLHIAQKLDELGIHFIEASWLALVDSLEYWLLKQKGGK